MLQLLAPFSSLHQLLAQSATVISTIVVVSDSKCYSCWHTVRSYWHFDTVAGILACFQMDPVT